MNEIMKENGVQIFENKEFGKIRTIKEGEKILFCASDVAKVLGYSNPRKALADHCKGVTKCYVPTNGGLQEVNFIPESDLYRLVLRSKLPDAEKFTDWVTGEVLPTTRKTGGYVGNDDLFIATYLPTADENTKLLFRTTLEVLKSQNKKIADQTKQLEEQKPKVEFADRVSNTDDLVDMGDMAKLITDKGIRIGRNRLFKFLRKKKILMSKNIPYQQYITQEYFVVKEAVKETDWGDKVFRTTYVTGKGQLFVYKKVRESFDKNESFWNEDSDEQLVPA